MSAVSFAPSPAHGFAASAWPDAEHASRSPVAGLEARARPPPASEAPSRPLTAKEKRNMLATPPNRRGENWSGRAGDSSGTAGLQEALRGARPLQTIDIESAIAAREAVRASGDGATADHIREQLNRAGVHVDDEARVWRSADGRTGRLVGNAAQQAAYSPQGTACEAACALSGPGFADRVSDVR